MVWKYPQNLCAMRLVDFTSSIVAGSAIGLGATAYLTVGGTTGAVLFSIGLLSVIVLQLNLFTGQAWKVWGFKGLGWLLLMLIGNAIGVGLSTALSQPENMDAAVTIIQSRIEHGTLACGLKAIPCGFIMTAAVRGAARQNLWPLLIGVPTFILCGFPHCIADMFYVCFCGLSQAIKFLLTIYPAIVLGNYIGCNLYRLAGKPELKNGKSV